METIPTALATETPARRPFCFEEALFEQMDRERLTPDERAIRILEIGRAERRRKATAFA